MQEPVLTKKQIFLSRLSLGIIILLLGLFLLLCGLSVIKLPFFKALLPAVLFAAALACFCWAFIQDNTLLLWLALPFALSASVSILAVVTAKGYGFYYPLYLLSPAAASFVTAIYSGKWHDHLKVIAVFGGLSIIFALNAIANVKWAIVLPILVLFLAACVIISAVFNKEKD